ncbi:MAG: DUF362 domain-containing protein [Eubacterium sp.]|nr:DUF362 domain-containing protein [Eubacterium sp.]
MYKDSSAAYNRSVSAAACGRYDVNTVRESLARVLEPLGGLDWVEPGMTIAIKVNLIAARAPEKAATTNPVLVTELCRMLTARGAEVIVGDSPGGTFTAGHLENVYRICGLTTVEEAGARLNRDFSIRDAVFQEAVSLKTFSYTGWLDAADCIIDFCKLKTHAMMKMTCAVKNLFGTIPGTTKPEYHMRFPDISDFANLMIDLNEYFRPRLCIVDAVDCMEGNGPTSGTPRHMGLLLASESPYDIDMAAAHLIGLGLADIDTLRQANLRGLGPASFEEVTCVGEALAPYVIGDFKTDIKRMGVDFSLGEGPFGKLSAVIFNAALKTRPQVRPKECVGCAKCADVCPAKAISMVRKKPSIDRGKCIRCFCCQEFCPVGAMKVHHTWAGNLIQKISNRG